MKISSTLQRLKYYGYIYIQWANEKQINEEFSAPNITNMHSYHISGCVGKSQHLVSMCDDKY